MRQKVRFIPPPSSLVPCLLCSIVIQAIRAPSKASCTKASAMQTDHACLPCAVRQAPFCPSEPRGGGGRGGGGKNFWKGARPRPRPPTANFNKFAPLAATDGQTDLEAVVGRSYMTSENMLGFLDDYLSSKSTVCICKFEVQ